MKKLIKYFYPKQEVSYFDKLKTNLFVILGYIGLLIIGISLIPDILSSSENFVASFFSKISVILFIFISFFILKKKGIVIGGNIFSLGIVIMLLIWMNILTENTISIFKYIQGFYSVFAVLIISILFATRKIIIINFVLILITTTRILIFAIKNTPENTEFFTTGFVTHTVTLLIITTIIYFTNKFGEATIKKAEENEAKFKQLSDLTFEGILIHDNGVVIDYNLACEKMFGYERDEIIGKNAITYLVVKKYHKIIAENIARKYTLPYEVEAIKKDGSIIPIEFEAKNIDLNNSTVRVTAIRDISLRKKAEQKLQNKHQELLTSEEELRATNDELLATTNALKDSNEELIIANEKAVQSSKLKTEFLNNLSHEVRTPLNGIIGFSQLLEDVDGTPAKSKNYIKIINESSEQLLRIIDDIVEISTLGTKQISLIETEVQLNNLILKLFDDFNLHALNNSTPLKIETGLSDDNCRIICDKYKLTRILEVFLDNAFKFSQSGEVILGYKVLNNNNISQIQFFVSDTGIGIKPENHKLIFSRFTQIDNELSREFGGLGIGLSIAMEHALLMGGEITLESEEGKGSAFYLTIPY